MKIGSLCAGYGGLEEGVRSVLGGEVAWQSEIDPGACKILAHRYPGVPNIGDMTVVDWSTVEPVDVLCGGTPCQDLSHAGKRAGMTEGTRSNLWVAMRDAIEQLRPRLVVWENVRGAYSAPADSELESREGRLGVRSDGPVLRALGRVLGDLSELGFDAEWVGLRAADVGAPHGRFRVFVVAWPAADTGHRAGHRTHERLGSRHLAAGARVVGHGLGAYSGATEESVHVGAERGAAAQDADLATRGERRLAAPGQAAGGRALGLPAGRGGTRAADADRTGPQGAQPAPRRHLSDRGAAANAARYGRHQGWAESAGVVGGSDAALGGDAAADADRDGLGGLEELHGDAWTGSEAVVERDDADGLAVVAGGLDWGAYTAAIRRWERLTRPAPNPTECGKNGQPRLSPAFVEWMMGLPAGWVTDVPGLSRNEQLKALGNGVVPQQAAQALRMLLPDVARAAA